MSSIVVSYRRRWHLSPVQFLFSLSFRLAKRRWWSEASPAPRFTQTSWRDFLNFLPVQTWPVWCSTDRSGDTQVALCTLLCWKTLPPISRLLKAQRLANLSPLSFVFHHCRSSFTIVVHLSPLSFVFHHCRSSFTIVVHLSPLSFISPNPCCPMIS